MPNQNIMNNYTNIKSNKKSNLKKKIERLKNCKREYEQQDMKNNRSTII